MYNDRVVKTLTKITQHTIIINKLLMIILLRALQYNYYYVTFKVLNHLHTFVTIIYV